MTNTTLEKWEEKTLGELCDVLDSRRKPITKKDRVAGVYPYYGATGILDYVSGWIFDEELVLLGEDGAKWTSGEQSAFKINGKTWVNNHAHVLRPKRDRISDNYLIYNLNFQNLMPYITGTTVPKLNQEKMRSITIPLPPLPEQERIVAKLDKAFEAIDKVKANAEQNLNNAKELFDGYLENIVAPKDKLGKYIKITTGKLNSNAAVENGQYPFFTCSRTPLKINNFAFDCEAILLAGNNASGDFNVKHYKGKFNAYQRTYVITIPDKSKLNYRYLYFQLFKALAELKKMSLGANTKFLRVGMITDFMLSMPTIEEQQKIVEKLDELQEQTKQLEQIYTQKIKECDELKQSILQKAFRGEL